MFFAYDNRRAALGERNKSRIQEKAYLDRAEPSRSLTTKGKGAKSY